MSAVIIPFAPDYAHKAVRLLPSEKLVQAAWNFARSALWPEQTFTSVEEEATKDYIREYFVAASVKKRAFTALCQRIVLTQKYVRSAANRYVPMPSVWFNRRYPFGFAGTLPWLYKVEQQRKEVPGYLAHIEALANGYYDYTIKPTTRSLDKCLSTLVSHNAHSLLQLFYNSIVHKAPQRA